MSVMNMFFAVRQAATQRRKRAKAYAELMSLDDRALADIGIHRSEIQGILAGAPATTCDRAKPAAARRVKARAKAA